MGRRQGGQPGNLNALKHGFYSKHFEKAELLDLDGASDLQEEIQMMRVVIRRLLKMARECKDMGELIGVLNTLGLAFFRSRSRQALRVTGLMKTQKFLGGNRDSHEEMLDRAIIDVLTSIEKRGQPSGCPHTIYLQQQLTIQFLIFTVSIP